MAHKHWVGPSNLVKCKPCPVAQSAMVCGSDGHTYTSKVGLVVCLIIKITAGLFVKSLYSVGSLALEKAQTLNQVPSGQGGKTQGNVIAVAEGQAGSEMRNVKMMHDA